MSLPELPNAPIPMTPSVEGHYEAGMVATVLRGCRACGQPHPRVRGIDSDVCECGAQSRPAETVYADQTVITGKGLDMKIARLFLKAAQKLNDFARRL